MADRDGWTFSYDPPILAATRHAGGRPEAGRVVVPSAARLGSVPGRRSDCPPTTPRHATGAIGVVRRTIDPILAAGAPLLLIGDFNVVDREVGYGDLAAGLIDAQRAVGLGPGLTWRPRSFEWLPFGLLRIDAVFSANGVEPLDIGPDCTPRGSDHCILHATLELPARRHRELHRSPIATG